MIFAGIVDTDMGIKPFGYVTSMIVTIGLWLVLAPAIGAVARGPGKDDQDVPSRMTSLAEPLTTWRLRR